MNDVALLKTRIRASRLRQVVRREGTSVYEGRIPEGEVYVKVSTNRGAQERQYEILKSLEGFGLVPRVIHRLDIDDQMVLVMSALKGERLDKVLPNASREEQFALLASAGSALGKLHRAIPAAQLRQMNFWRVRDKIPTDSVSWNEHLRVMVHKWSSRVDTGSADYDQFRAQLAIIVAYSANLREPTQCRLLHCDYIGRNILTNVKNDVSGILDFDAARIGDAAYDLAKIVWANMDFPDVAARQKLLNGWEQAYEERVPEREFLYYVGVQCLAAIAWTDTNPPLSGAAGFRSAAIRALRAAVSELERFNGIAWTMVRPVEISARPLRCASLPLHV